MEDRIIALANEMGKYKMIQSIPGIGEKIAATIISEIGEIDRFNHPKKLVAFAGVDPSVHSGLRQPSIVLQKEVRVDYAIPCILPYYAV
ncbi:transposase [Peribacillus huizhouensis]|uniref:Transposase n=1 Tax=Peribacillus huizhouensis TaxID=1501239 RepID=A0ABR6CS52_9BACI|nr:transposase [Peribacillus huizhouensis]